MKQTQKLEHLKSGRALTRWDCLIELSIWEAPARISELKRDGYPIKTTMITVTNRYGEKVKVAQWTMENESVK